jgi:hypothetical protein
MNYFRVNQKQTYKQERNGGYLWAPKKDKSGKTKWHWESILLVNPDGIIFNHAKSTHRNFLAIAIINLLISIMFH